MGRPQSRMISITRQPSMRLEGVALAVAVGHMDDAHEAGIPLYN